MKISAVITTRNRYSLLKRAVDSVKRQTYSNIEIVVVDDASTDETLNYGYILELEGHIYVRIPSEDSKGGNYARNIGISRCTGDYIAFLDDDDVWSDKKIEKQVSLIQSHPDAGMIYCGMKIDYGTPFLKYDSLPNRNCCGDIMSKKAYWRIFCVTSTLMVKKSLLVEIRGFDENLSFWQEYEMILRLIQVTHVYFVNEPLATITRDMKDKHRLTNQYLNWKLSVEYIYLKHKELFSMLGQNDCKLQREFYFREAAYRAYAYGDKNEMKRMYIEAFKTSGKLEYYLRAVFGISKGKTILIEVTIAKLNNLLTKIAK